MVEQKKKKELYQHWIFVRKKKLFKPFILGEK